MSQPDPTPNSTTGADLMAKAIEAHEENCPICQSNYRKHCHERETVVDFAELQITLLSATAELDHLRGEFERLAPALPVLDGIVRLTVGGRARRRKGAAGHDFAVDGGGQMTLLEAAQQALPGLDWGGDDDQVSAVNAGGPVITIWRSADTRVYAGLAYSEIAPLSYPSPQGLAMDLRGDLERHRDLLSAALCDPPHLGTSAADWAGMWDVARQRADAAEAEVKRLQAEQDAAIERALQRVIEELP